MFKLLTVQSCKFMLFFQYWTYLFTTLEKTVSNVGVSFISISQPWKNCFQYWTVITVTNLGNAVSNVGLSFYIYQPWKCSFQCWTFFTFTNLGWLKINYQPWKTIKWLSNVGECISFSNIGFPIIFQCFPKFFPMFLQFRNLTIFSCDFAAKFTCSGQSWINQSRSIWFHPACQCNVWNLKQAEEVCVDLHDHGNHNSPSHKSSSSVIGSLFCSVAIEIGFFFCIMWNEQSTLLSNANQQKDLIHESLVAENSYVLIFPKWSHVH